MELKEQFINAVVRNMEPELEAKQLRKLKIVLTINLEKLRLEEECRDVIIYDETSDIAAYKQYFVSMKLRGLSPGTINLAMRTIDKFNRWVRVSFNDVTTNDIRLYIANREINDHLSSATLDRERGAICRFFKWLFEEEYISRDPGRRVEKIKVEKRLKKAFTPVEVELMRNACRKPKEKATFELLLSTGCRVTELTMLTMENYDQQRGTITVIGKGNKERVVFVNARAKVAIDNYLVIKPHSEGPILCGLHGVGTAMTSNGIQKMVKEIGKRAGVTHVHPHKFRRTAATLALKRGMSLNDVRRFLGHTDVDTTLQYIDTSGSDLKLEHEKYVA
ncbi:MULTISPECIES: tyrosine-type recombinase/integrase [Enterococcus]|uniref:tyrosine-type recombinase/integrase n=1 Tax=Enterococcus TaxID=1350 RepID=UPI001C8C3CB6|nr:MULTISPECIES: tyrosine-type recombinase/integrase [Enterococcus]MBS6069076.1 tyrosine-type recombinase/integrase [Enterococcus avium]MBX9121894.1 tyrosine-type recombinase/integrase [Enterococcus sp. K18_3]MCO5513696.1 tyrosine-type recombinase/integrase [Enterococcus faecalis]MCO5519181.1 tyrosine-type recombinase/integrase [Enterococcus faecalis]